MAAKGIDRLVFSSTCATYGAPPVNPIREDTPQVPINPYGRSKLMVEDILRDLSSRSALSVVSLRYFNAAGADASGEIGEHHEPETHLIPLMLRAATLSSEPLTVLGSDLPTLDGTCIRDYVHVTDLADAHVKSFAHTLHSSGFSALNLGTGKGVSIKQLITMAEKVTGSKIPHIYAPRREGDPAALVADPQLARDTLGWVPGHSDLNHILQTAWSWVQRKR
jgi:UDP-glucose-4-epimerase GalE